MIFNQQILPSQLVVSLLRAFIDPSIVLSMFILSFICVIVCGLFEWTRICASLLSFAYICIVIGDQEGRGYISLIGLIPSHLFACSSHDLDFQRHLLRSAKKRGSSLFRWYWRNGWPSLFISWYFPSQNINR